MTLSNKPVSGVISDLNQEELGSLLEACGFAIKNDTILSIALSEIHAQIPCLQDNSGNISEEFANVIEDFDLSLLGILAATRLVEITALQGTSFKKSLSKEKENV